MLKKEALEALGAERLAQIILVLYAENSNLTKDIRMVIARFTSNVNELDAILIKSIKAIIKRKKYIEYYEVSKYAKELSALCNRISDLGEIAPRLAVNHILLIFNEYEAITSGIEGHIDDFFSNLLELLGKLYTKLKLPKEEIANFVFQNILSDEHCIYYNIVECFTQVLGDEGLAILKNKLTEALTVAKSDDKRDILRTLRNIADATHNVDDFIAIVKQDSDSRDSDSKSDNGNLEIASRLIEAGRASEALGYIKDYKITSEDSIDRMNMLELMISRPIILRIKAFDVMSQFDEARKERVRLLKMFSSSELYYDILDHFTPENTKPAFSTEIVEHVAKCKDIYRAVLFLAEIEQAEAAAVLIYKNAEVISGKYYEILRKIITNISTSHPLAATLLHRAIISYVLDGKRSKYYHHAASDLKECAKLQHFIKDWKQFTPHQDYDTSLYQVHKKKSAFWEYFPKTENGK